MGLSDEALHQIFGNTADNGSIHNRRMGHLGKAVLTLHITEHLFYTHPNMPENALGDIVEHFTSPQYLATIASNLGLHHALHTGQSVDGSDLPREGAAVGTAFQAFVGALHNEHGSQTSRQYARDFVVHTLAKADLDQFVKMEHPKLMLRHLLRDSSQQLQTRVVRESGRHSNLPTFVVGVFVGENMLASAASYRLDRAEKEAAQQALRDHFLQQVKDAPLPSAMADYAPEAEISMLSSEATQE